MANIFRKMLGLPDVYDLDSKEEERIRYIRSPWFMRVTYGIIRKNSNEHRKDLIRWSKFRYGD